MATDENSISEFNTAVTTLTAQCAQDNDTMSQLSKMNQTMQSNQNTTMKKLQTIKHQMNYCTTKNETAL